MLVSFAEGEQIWGSGLNDVLNVMQICTPALKAVACFCELKMVKRNSKIPDNTHLG